jgi:hypothetical protein
VGASCFAVIVKIIINYVVGAAVKGSLDRVIIVLFTLILVTFG